MVTVSEAQLLAWLGPVLWPMLRVLAMLQAMPVVGQRAVPVRVKVGLALFVAIGLQPSLPPGSAAAMAAVALDSPAAFALVAQQLVVGLALGFAVRLVFAAAELAGEACGLTMGLNFAGFFDPATASQGTASARLLATIVSLMFVAANGHLAMIAALAKSFTAFPVAPEPFDFLARARPELWGATVFEVALVVALPLVGMLLFVNLVLGVVSRVAPQLGIFQVGFPITVSVGLAGTMLTLPLLERPIADAIAAMLARFG